MSGLWGGGQLGKELPRPKWTVVLLWTLGLTSWLLVAADLVALLLNRGLFVISWPEQLAMLMSGLIFGAISIGLALMLKYLFSVSVSARLMERMLRDGLEKRGSGGEATVPEMGGASHAEVVSLLSEIMENTLLGDAEKVEKRQLAKKHRQQTLRREIEALIRTNKFRDARERLEEFSLRYSQTPEVAELGAQLSEALRQHEVQEIANVTEQVQRYMGLGLWERALETAVGLAQQFPENPDAARVPETVRMEHAASARQEQQRLYREIEHLVARKHWRQALHAAETLVQKYPDSPEAGRLRDQLEELRRNAAIAERKEWETRIAEHVQTGRHLEAYNLAMELMNKYPDSPQATDIRKRLDQLKARAGIVE
jgi:outer membrane protein assembly factor BamD (BamD/ComL family)